MNEIEVKILEIDAEGIIQKLEAWGAKKIFDGEIVASYFDFDSRELFKQDKLLRLRRKGEKCELTFKKTLSLEKARIMDEFEVTLDDYGGTKKILFELGLKEYKRLAKHRLSYLFEGAHFEIDRYPEIPAYLEIEAPNLEKLEELVRKLGFSMSDTKPWSVKNVLEHYGKL